VHKSVTMYLILLKTRRS